MNESEEENIEGLTVANEEVVDDAEDTSNNEDSGNKETNRGPN